MFLSLADEFVVDQWRLDGEVVIFANTESFIVWNWKENTWARAETGGNPVEIDCISLEEGEFHWVLSDLPHTQYLITRVPTMPSILNPTLKRIIALRLLPNIHTPSKRRTYGSFEDWKPRLHRSVDVFIVGQWQRSNGSITGRSRFFHLITPPFAIESISVELISTNNSDIPLSCSSQTHSWVDDTTPSGDPPFRLTSGLVSWITGRESGSGGRHKIHSWDPTTNASYDAHIQISPSADLLMVTAPCVVSGRFVMHTLADFAVTHVYSLESYAWH